MRDPIEALLLAITHSRAGRHAEADILLHEVLAADPHQPNALFLLGQSALSCDRPAEAADFLTRALRLRPTHRDGRVALARALLSAAGRPRRSTRWRHSPPIPGSALHRPCAARR